MRHEAGGEALMRTEGSPPTGADSDSEKYPIVKVSWLAGDASNRPRGTDPSTLAAEVDSFSQQNVKPAKAANIGIYTAAGTLDAQSRLAQAAREVKEKTIKHD